MDNHIYNKRNEFISNFQKSYGEDFDLEKGQEETGDLEKSLDELICDIHKSTDFAERQSIQKKINNKIEKAVAREIEGRELLFKSQEDTELDGIWDESENLQKSEDYYNSLNDLEKGGVGSGRVIGHTKIGSKVYENYNHPSHKDFTSSEHLQASNLHADLNNKKSTLTSSQSDEASAHHFREYKKREKAEEGLMGSLRKQDPAFLGYNLKKSVDEFLELEKGLGERVHKYIEKIGSKYVYESPRVVSSINDLREYHKQKTGLDSIKNSLDKSPASINTRELYKQYNQKKSDFKTKYGHEHNSEEADHKKRLTVTGMLNHIDNRIHDNKMSRLEKGDESELIKELIVQNELKKSEGSRGGKVIGHTKSGKPVYEHKGDINNEDHKHVFYLKDHGFSDKELEEEHEIPKEHIEAAKDLKKQGYKMGKSFDWKQNGEKEDYQHKMSKTHEVHPFDDGSDEYHHIIRKK